MPTITRNIRPFLYPKGTKTATGRADGHHPAAAIQAAVDAFIEEHDFEPEQDDRCFITVAFTTFDTLAEISVFPEDY